MVKQLEEGKRKIQTDNRQGREDGGKGWRGAESKESIHERQKEKAVTGGQSTERGN